MDHVCFILALDNHNPWITNSPEDAWITWQRAVEAANKAIVEHKREPRKEGAFEAQWQRLLRDVHDKKTKSLKATGANFSQNKAYATLYNLVDLYNTSSFKLSFLKPVEIPSSTSLASQQEHVQQQKWKQAVSDAHETGQIGQTLALQRLHSCHNSGNLALESNMGEVKQHLQSWMTIMNLPLPLYPWHKSTIAPPSLRLARSSSMLWISL